MDCLFINTHAHITPEAGEHEKVAWKNISSVQNLKDFFIIFPEVKTKHTYCRLDPVNLPPQRKSQKNPNQNKCQPVDYKA